MGFLNNVRSLFRGVAELFSFFGGLFDALPLVCRVLIYFGFGGVMLLCLFQMLRSTT